MWNRNNYSRKFWVNSKCKCDQGKAILDGIEFRVSKIIHKDICIKVHELCGWGLLCASMSFSILRCTIATNAFSSDLKTHKSQTFLMIVPRGIAKLSTSPKVTIFPPPVPYYFISDKRLKGDGWTTLFLRNSMVAMVCKVFEPIKLEIFWEEAYVSIKFLTKTHLLLYRFKYIKLLQAQSLTVFEMTILGNFYSFQKFCSKLAKFIPSKTCFMVIGSLQIC